MYTNIDSSTGITANRAFITTNINQLPQDYPTDLFLQILKIVMENNVFEFSGSYWLQLIGTAMGTPAACAYATISYGQHENDIIIPSFAPQLLYYKCYIDDIFGVWLPPKRNRLAKWNEFKLQLNNWGSLQWIIEEPSKHTTFLDLNISIENNSITTSTFQKTMNRYLYIPPLSSHPPSCLKGLIAGELRRYYLQNNTENFQEILAKFIGRLLDRGYNIEDISLLYCSKLQITWTDNLLTMLPLLSHQLFICTGHTTPKGFNGMKSVTFMMKLSKSSDPMRGCE
jgi:hypothetical protein